MKQFDYIGDAVWELAWRIFENRNFSEMTGWHRTLRKQIVSSNSFMNLVAISEKIETSSQHWFKANADGLENHIGKIELENNGEGVKIALDIMKRNINIESINRETKNRIMNLSRSGKPKGIKSDSNMERFLNSREKQILGEFF